MGFHRDEQGRVHAVYTEVPVMRYLWARIRNRLRGGA